MTQNGLGEAPQIATASSQLQQEAKSAGAHNTYPCVGPELPFPANLLEDFRELVPGLLVSLTSPSSSLWSGSCGTCHCWRSLAWQRRVNGRVLGMLDQPLHGLRHRHAEREQDTLFNSPRPMTGLPSHMHQRRDTAVQAASPAAAGGPLGTENLHRALASTTKALAMQTPFSKPRAPNTQGACVQVHSRGHGL